MSALLMPAGHRRRTQLALGATALGLAAAAVALGPVSAPAASGPQLAESPDISVTNAKAHLDDLQQIADANGGRRSNGTTGYRASVDWAKAKFEAAGYTVTVQEFTTGTLGTTKSWNVIAEWPHGDAEHVVMAGAHLDSVSAGPGINDNGTGTAGIVETALTYAASGKTPKNRLRFALWGAEEIGLVGSKYYSAQLSQAEKDKIELYLNFDMIGSPNPGYFVYDDNPAGNGARDELTRYFDSRTIPWEYIDVQGRSDHASFRAAGIPTAGTFTGAEARKTAAQAAKWGGTANAPFDPCYHQSCDSIENLDLGVFDANIDAIGHMIWLYSDKDYGTTPPPPPGCTQTNGTDVAIGDNATVESPVTVSGCTGNASATAKVAVNIAHTYIGDLKVDLVAPDGSVYVLHNRAGGSADNINTTYTVNLSSEAANGTWKLRVNDNAGGDTGKIDTWTLTTGGGGTAPPPCAPQTNGTDVPIADNATVESSVTIAGCTGNASATAKVAVNIAHTYIGDLKVDLVAPDGSVYVLHNRAGGSADNINTTYTVNLSSEVANGTWKLRVNDNASQDTGKIDTWTLTP